VASASAAESVQGLQVVNVTLTAHGSHAWDRATQLYFHQFLAVVIDGVVVSAPLVQPTQAAWSSFNGQLQLSGYWSDAQAQAVASGLLSR
jgi:preprotein translocase subunit SecD